MKRIITDKDEIVTEIDKMINMIDRLENAEIKIKIVDKNNFLIKVTNKPKSDKKI